MGSQANWSEAPRACEGSLGPSQQAKKLEKEKRKKKQERKDKYKEKRKQKEKRRKEIKTKRNKNKKKKEIDRSTDHSLASLRSTLLFAFLFRFAFASLLRISITFASHFDCFPSLPTHLYAFGVHFTIKL